MNIFNILNEKCKLQNSVFYVICFSEKKMYLHALKKKKAGRIQRICTKMGSTIDMGCEIIVNLFSSFSIFIFLKFL